MPATSVLSHAMANWRNAVVAAENAAHALAKVQSIEAAEALAADPTEGGKRPLQWGSSPDPLDRGQNLDIYDSPR